MNLSDYLMKLPFWKEMTLKEQMLIESNSAIKEYPKGFVMHNHANECNGMSMILEGKVRVSVISKSGREVNLHTLSSGEVCVLSISCLLGQITFDTVTTFMEDSVVLIINTSVFDRVMKENINVRCYIYELLSERFSSAMWTMQMILFNGYDTRLATFLVSKYENSGQDIIRMTHEEIAVETNSAREVVARMIKRFEAEGLVENKRGQILIKNITALKEIADDI